jgi:hypothetical protein
MTMRPSRLAALFSVATCLAGSALARAQPPDRIAAAEALFEHGRALVERGETAAACPMFEESQRLDPAVGTLLWLADCYASEGQTPSALVVFKEAAAAAARTHDRRLAVALAKVDELEKKPSPPVIVAPPPTAKPEPPQEPTSPPVAAVDTTPAAETRTEGPDAGGGQRWIGIASIGLGAVGLIMGSVWSLEAKATYDRSTTGPCTANDICTRTGLDERSSAQTMATEATVAIGVGAAAIVGGAILLFTAPRRAGTVLVAPAAWYGGGSVTMSGAF